MSESAPPLHAQYMRRQHVAWELGITRHTLSRLLRKDETFPPFFAITPGIEVIARSDFEQWIHHKRVASRAMNLIAPKTAATDQP
ncbi:MAG: hypothetical protein Q8K45_19380 [Rubrivivax sp.]|nr:hypothetical protein [Rubrivivax sp.]